MRSVKNLEATIERLNRELMDARRELAEREWNLRTYQYGSRFSFTASGDELPEVYMLAQVEGGVGMLISVTDGNRWSDVKVELRGGRCSEEDIDELVGADGWEYVGTMRQPSMACENYGQGGVDE